MTTMRDRLDVSRPEGSGDPPPRRRHRILLDLHADSWEELLRAVEHGVLFRLFEAEEGRELTVVTSGGCGSGWHLEHYEDESMTPELYRRELEVWLRSQREEK